MDYWCCLFDFDKMFFDIGVFVMYFMIFGFLMLSFLNKDVNFLRVLVFMI